jgi:hypothetical protein
MFKVTTSFFLDSVVIKYSLAESNNRLLEEAVMLLWNDYIMECDEENDVEVSLADVLKFMTGSRTIPAIGFNDIPSILFINGLGLPTASTCDLSITFSREYGKFTYKQFKEKFNFAIQNSPGFGIP